MEIEKEKLNHLAGESSPYLLQHVKNPVDWYPWGDAALNKARKEGKPIFLSVGYSACHWCHVMAHETFENEEIAQFLNDNFVSIKVDKEERPEIDHIYMQAVQALSGRGGWPLTVFLTPDGIPFFGGTYFPPENRHGMPGFGYIAKVMAEAYGNDKEEIVRHGVELQSALEQVKPPEAAEIPTSKVLDDSCRKIDEDFDKDNGGFGDTPKFPEAVVVEFLLRTAARKKDRKIFEKVELTLKKMAEGGIYDQLGGGFHRYSTDNQWRIPHFEKMLYDNALLSSLYLHAYQATHNELYKRIACETLDYLLREMASQSGGFYSSQDADTEGREGKYYTWTAKEIDQIAGAKNAEQISRYYGVTGSGNFEGRNVLYVTDRLSIDKDLLAGAKSEMFQAREQRVRPNRDDKIIASWNGLALCSLSEAGAALGRKDYLDAAQACAGFIAGSMMQDANLVHTHSGDKPGIEGYLEDYALVILGLLKLQTVIFSAPYLNLAISLADTMIDRFVNNADGLFYDNPNASDKLFVRPRNTIDSPLPSGNSAAIGALLYIWALTGKESYKEVAERSLKGMQKQMASFPRGFAGWLCALDFSLAQRLELAVIGKEGDRESQKFINAIYSEYLPNKVLCSYDPAGEPAGHGVLLLKDRGMVNGKATVYICESNTCLAPITNIEELSSSLQNLRPDLP